MTAPRRRPFAVLVVFALLVLAAVALTAAPADARSVRPTSLKEAPKPNAIAEFKARGSIEGAYVTGAKAGANLLLVNRANGIVARGKTDRFGSKVFYEQKPGTGYRVFSVRGRRVAATKRFRVLKAGQNPPASFYEKKTLQQGLNYVTVRDGVEIAMTVRLPSGKTLADGPFPTFVEYSGYQTAAPNDAFGALLGGTKDPLAPATSTAVGSIVGPLLNFATVSVQMRGTGCSGGAFDLFALPALYDGYDAIETVAAQPWVKGGKVGMGGISWSGITQLFTAGTQPPHLAAISPMSVTDDRYLASVYPGGIFNKGFQLNWLEERMADAAPAPEGGQDWAKILTTTGDPDTGIAGPDQHCVDNQRLRLQSRDAVEQTLSNPFRVSKKFDERSPASWIPRIKVPVFLVGQFQDEQTSSHFVDSLERLNKNQNVWITIQNGVHSDSLGPSSITRWVDFMNLFVADRIPVVPDLIKNYSSVLYKALAESRALPVEQSRFAEYTDVDLARTEFKKDPRIRILMDNGDAVPGTPGAIGAKWELDYPSWPIKRTRATPFYLGTKGGLATRKAKAGKQASYVSDPKARPAMNLMVEDPGAEAWYEQPRYDWAPLAKGKGLGFTTPALAKDTVVAGASSVDLWLKSSARDTDIQATLSEVRPDGNETFVQTGWLRASHRKLDRKRSTETDPFPTHYERDAAPLPKGKFTLVRVPIYPAVHAFRAGSKIRISISAVGGDRAIWDFATLDKGKTRNTILLGGKKASRIVLPVIQGETAKGTPLPGPTALRGQPSRTYSAASNGG